ncbi:MAG: sugar ABC transporter permease [Chloroflexi bacterium HGW-Chloroflexi-3]|nr:MAG: sugar ABC transporter permease [Chloroflexi bacterium HGW-Chloroflexi-3]
MYLSLKTQKKLMPLLFLIPGLLFFAIFQIYPLLKGFQMSFLDWQIMPGKVSEFVGLDNYARAFNDVVFGRAFKNTLIYTLVTVPGQMIIAMIVAILINSLPKGKTLFRALYYIPVITSWVIVSLLIRYFFQSPNGIVNYFLVEVFHLVEKPLPWLRDPALAFVPILILGIWKGIGWSMVIYLAALAGVPKELEEASAMDGANGWQNFWHITMPLISPTIVFTMVMLLIGGFNVFISVYLITGGGPRQMTEVMLSYAYHQAFDFLDFGYGAALSYLMAALIITLSFLQIKLLRKPQEIY